MHPGLPDLLSRPSEPVYVTEGEKAADAAASIGLLATTSPHGSKSAGNADWSTLAGRDVIILPDNDDAGKRYADDVAAILAKLRRPATVRVIRLPDLPERGDMADWLDVRECVDPDELRATVERLADAAGIWTPATDETDREADKAGPVLVNLASVKAEPIRWLWPGRIALGKLTLISGDPGLGKSFVTLDIAARVSRGLAARKAIRRSCGS